jgi:hypothetical protein
MRGNIRPWLVLPRHRLHRQCRAMAAADIDAFVNDIFAALSPADLHRRPYEPEDRDAEAAKVARLRQLRLATHAKTPKKSPRLILTRS